MAKLSEYKNNPGINPLDRITYSGVIENYEDVLSYETVSTTVDDLAKFISGYFEVDGVIYDLNAFELRIDTLEQKVDQKITNVSFDTSNGNITFDFSGGAPSITENIDGRYLRSFDESDPIFNSHIVSSVAEGSGFLKRSNGSWLYDSNVYLTEFIETDPVFTGQIGRAHV